MFGLVLFCCCYLKIITNVFKEDFVEWEMDHESLKQYQGCNVKLILSNNFWYKGKVTSVSENEFAFIDIKGNNISVDPNFIIMIEEVRG